MQAQTPLRVAALQKQLANLRTERVYLSAVVDAMLANNANALNPLVTRRSSGCCPRLWLHPGSEGGSGL